MFFRSWSSGYCVILLNYDVLSSPSPVAGVANGAVAPLLSAIRQEMQKNAGMSVLT